MLRYALCALMLVLGAHAAEARPFLKVLGDAAAPQGWLGFCKDHPRMCHAGPRTPRTLALTAQMREELAQVNRQVNASVMPLSDQTHWGVAERWSYPDDGYGDCEDYALLKQRMLIERGWNPSALLIAKAYRQNGEGHAVLMVMTTQGELILDDQTNEAQPWYQTPYFFTLRQSPEDPNRWQRIMAASTVGRAYAQ